MHNPVSPGELLKEFLGDRTATELAEPIGVARATISRILIGRNAISVDLSIRLGESAPVPGLLLEGAAPARPVVRISKKRPKIKPLAA